MRRLQAWSRLSAFLHCHPCCHTLSAALRLKPLTAAATCFEKDGPTPAGTIITSHMQGSTAAAAPLGGEAVVSGEPEKARCGRLGNSRARSGAAGARCHCTACSGWSRRAATVVPATHRLLQWPAEPLVHTTGSRRTSMAE